MDIFFCSCSTDYVLVYSVSVTLHEGLQSDQAANETLTLIGRYCNESLPGPQLSEDDSAHTQGFLRLKQRGHQHGIQSQIRSLSRNCPSAKVSDKLLLLLL